MSPQYFWVCMAIAFIAFMMPAAIHTVDQLTKRTATKIVEQRNEKGELISVRYYYEVEP